MNKFGLQLMSHAWAEGSKAAEFFALPFPSSRIINSSGEQLGRGSGQSTEYQEHRPYAPGDELRHIDWSALARTGQYFTKVYRREQARMVDIIVDSSRSMFFSAERGELTLKLLFFSALSAQQDRASIKISLVSGAQLIELPLQALVSAENFQREFVTLVQQEVPVSGAPVGSPIEAIMQCRRRPGALVIFISDLLFLESPSAILNQLSRGEEMVVIFSPFTKEEQHPNWDNRIEFIECETGAKQRILCNEQVRKSYGSRYALHFSNWLSECQRHRGAFSRILVNESFSSELLSSVSVGAVIPRVM